MLYHPWSFWALFVWFLFLQGASLRSIGPFLITDLFTRNARWKTKTIFFKPKQFYFLILSFSIEPSLCPASSSYDDGGNLRGEIFFNLHGNNTSGALGRKLGWVVIGEGGWSRSLSWLSTNLISFVDSISSLSYMFGIFFLPKSSALQSRSKVRGRCFLFNEWVVTNLFRNQFLRNLPYFS